MIELVKADDARIGMDGYIYVGIQCDCGWSVIAWSPRNDEAHHDLYDSAERALLEHVKSANNPKCQAWLK